MSARARLPAAQERRPLCPRSVLCSVEPAVASLDAAHQAVELAGTGPVAFVSAATRADRSMDSMYLDAAVLLARRDGAPGEVRRVGGGGAVAHLLARAARHDLFVVGASPAPGQLSSLARVAIRRSAMPVLVARRLSHGSTLGDRVVVVPGDTGGNVRAAGLAAALARNARAEIASTVTDHGGSADAVLHAARGARATVIVIGGPATPRWRNAADVGVTVAERAPCSVLIARGRA